MIGLTAGNQNISKCQCSMQLNDWLLRSVGSKVIDYHAVMLVCCHAVMML